MTTVQAPAVPLSVRSMPAPAPPRRSSPGGSRLRRALKRFSPARLFPGAVFEKEVRAQGRRWGTYITRGTYGFLLLALMSIVFVAFLADNHQQGARAIQEFQTLAPAMTTAVLWFQFIVLTLIAPTIMGPAISDEKRTGTLATLLTTPLTAGQIVLGKLAGGFVQLFILALIATPMLLVIRVFGGVQASTIIAGLAVGISMAVMAACLALAVSVGAKRGTTAAVGGFVLALAFHGLPALAMSLINWKFKTGIRWDVIIGTSSPLQMAVVSADLMGGGGPPVVTVWLWLWNSLYSLTIGALAVVVATFRLRRVMIREGAGGAGGPAALPTTPAPDLTREAPPTAPGALARPRTVSKPSKVTLERSTRDVGEQPVLWREVRQPLFARKWQLPVLVLAMAGLMIWIYSVAGVNDREIHVVVGVIGMVAAIIFAASLPIAAITGEREARTWETLLTTRLSAREIILGKIAGALKRQWVLPALLGVNFLLAGVLTGTLHPIFLFHYLMLIAVPAVFLSTTGVLASLIVKRSVQAAVLNAGLALAIWAGIPLLYALSDNLFRRLGLSNTVETGLIVSNPVPLAVTAAEGATYRNSSWSGPETRYRLPDIGRVSMLTFTLIVVGHCALYAALSAGAFALAVRCFRRWGGRT